MYEWFEPCEIERHQLNLGGGGDFEVTKFFVP